MATNGTSCAPSRIVAVRFYGDRQAQVSSVADRDGEGVLPIPRNFWIAITALIAGKRKSKRGCLETAILMSGNCLRNPNGCGGALTIATPTGSTHIRRFWMKEFPNFWLSCLHLLNRSMKRVREEISILWRPDT